MCLEAMHSWLAFVLDPTRFIIFFAGRGDDGCIDQRAGLHPDRLGFELGGDRVEQHFVQFPLDQDLAKAHERRAFRRRLR